MKKIQTIIGKAIPFERNDVDTDLIIPAQYLTSTTQDGYGQFLFQRLKEQDSQFIFNQPEFLDATILLSGNNFGCGSSREHAVWALQQAGISAIIALSFADIFAANALKNGLLLITLSPLHVSALLTAAQALAIMTIHLEQQEISCATDSYHFEIDSFQKYCLLNGIDQFDYLLEHRQLIAEFKHKQQPYDFINKRQS